MPDGILKFILKYGFPSVAAVIFGYLYVGEIRADQRNIIIEQQNLARGVIKLADKQGETQMLQEKILGVMRVMCIQGAKTQTDRRDCLKE